MYKSWRNSFSSPLRSISTLVISSFHYSFSGVRHWNVQYSTDFTHPPTLTASLLLISFLILAAFLLTCAFSTCALTFSLFLLTRVLFYVSQHFHNFYPLEFWYYVYYHFQHFLALRNIFSLGYLPHCRSSCNSVHFVTDVIDKPMNR